MTKQLSAYKAKDIVGYEGLYAVTDCGKVYSHSRVYPNGKLHKGRWMKPQKNPRGYLWVGLTNRDGIKKSECVHILVARMFCENKKSLPIVNHIDEDKTNNSSYNLEWCTHQYNSEHSLANTYEVTLPDGTVTIITNLKTFCDEHGLDNGAMYKVAKGIRNSHKIYKVRRIK